MTAKRTSSLSLPGGPEVGLWEAILTDIPSADHSFWMTNRSAFEYGWVGQLCAHDLKRQRKQEPNDVDLPTGQAVVNYPAVVKVTLA